MALIECPECRHRISDRAVACPSCGFPLTPLISPAVPPAPSTDDSQPAVPEPPPKPRISTSSPPITSRVFHEGFRNPRSLANWLTALLILLSLFYGLAIWGGVLKLDLLSRAVNRGQFTTEWARTIVYSSSPIAAILSVVTAIVFLRWVYVVAKNARSIGAGNPRLFEHPHELTFTPGWAVGWYFVPVFNLWRPYQAMRWIWKASRNPADGERKKSNYILRSWWTFWIISNLLSLTALSAAARARTPSDYSIAVTDNMASDAVDILLCVFAIFLVRSVSRRQLSTAASIAS